MRKSLLTSAITQRDPKGQRFMQNVGAAYDKASLNEHRAQRLNEDPNFISKLRKLIDAHSRPDDKFFTLLNTFDVVVPEEYIHSTRFDLFRKIHGKEFRNFDEPITDKIFPETTNELVPGHEMQCKVFEVRNHNVSSCDLMPRCMSFLKSQGAVLVGGRGLTLVYEQHKDKLQNNHWPYCCSYVSLDTQTTLPWIRFGIQEDYRIPILFIDRSGFEFRLGCFSLCLNGDPRILCFCKK